MAVPELPDSIVILGTGLSDPEPGAPPADPVKDVEARFLTEPGKAAVDAPQQAYVGDGALDAAKGPASEPRPEVLTLPLSFDLDNERVNVVVTPESFSEVLIGLYIAGEWKWVQSFLHAVGASLLRANVVGRGNQLYRQPKADPADSARLRAFGDAAQTAIGALNDHIASALVALALQVTDKAQELSATTTASLTEQERIYGITVRPPPADTGQGGAEGGSGSDSAANAPAAENTAPHYESAQPEVAADLVAAVEEVVTACASYQGLQQAFDKAKQEKKSEPPSSTGSGGPSGAGGGAGGQGASGGQVGSGGQSGAEGGTGTNPPPALKDVQSAQERVAKTLKDAAAQHRLAPGIAALCLKQKKEGQSLGDQVVFAATVQYLAQARASLTQLPATYDVSSLDYAVRGALPRVLLDPEVRLEDRPEVRAAVFSGARVASGGFQPLASDLLLGEVRRDVVRAATGPVDDDEKVRAAFTLAVLNSYLASADARDAIPAAKAKEERAPLKVLSKITAAASLLGLFVRPVALVAGGLGMLEMAGNAYLQFRSVAESNKVLDAAALDALLADETAAFAQIVASKPRGIDVLTEVGASVGEMMLLDRVFPLAGLAVGAWSDVETLIED